MSKDKKKIQSFLSDFVVIDAVIRAKDIFGFLCQRSKTDPLESSEFMIVLHYPDDPVETQWGWIQDLGSARQLSITPVYSPEERMLVLADTGHLLRVGGGEIVWERPDLTGNKVVFRNIKVLKSGKAVAVSSDRGVFCREGNNSWVSVGDRIETTDDSSTAGFLDVDSFADDDVYAVGDNGDAWNFDGQAWSEIEMPTNAALEKVLCANDGTVYITTRNRRLLCGSENSWEFFDHVFDGFVTSIVEFEDRILLSTISSVYEVSNDEVVKVDFDLPKMDSYGLMASLDGRLLLACASSSYYYENGNWTEIYKI